MNFQEAVADWKADAQQIAALGVILPEVGAYLPPEFKHDYTMAMDAAPSIQTSANASVPAFLTTFVDPDVLKVLFTPNKAAEIFEEKRKGTWLDETALFTVVEHTGEVTSYGDFNEGGRTGVNQAFPQRQSYLFQTVSEYGDRELERAGLTRMNFVSEIDVATATVMDKFLNRSYFFGIAGLQNYGLLNDPALPASISPATKAWNSGAGITWFNGNAIAATANEIFNDVQALFSKLVAQTAGRVDAESKMTLAMSPFCSTALVTTNSFGITVQDMLKKAFPNLTVKTAVQYGARSVTNPEGVVGGNLMQLIADSVEGQDTGYCSFNEKMHAHPMVRGTSSYKQKKTGGTWGAIIRVPYAVASMIGV